MDNGGKRSPFKLDGVAMPEPFAFEVRTYGHSPSGYLITERIPLLGELPVGFPRFITNVLQRIQAGGKQYEKGAQNVPVPGDDILEAMVNLVGVVDATSRRLHQEMMAKITGKQLVRPGDPGFRL